MKSLLSYLYALVLALWVGGIAMYTFVVTPVIFKMYGRDAAGEVVSALFPGYFLYNLILSAAAVGLAFLIYEDRSSKAAVIASVLASLALAANIYLKFDLHPRMETVKKQVASFETERPDSGPRREFRMLHGLSMTLNLLVLIDGAALIWIRQNLR